MSACHHPANGRWSDPPFFIPRQRGSSLTNNLSPTGVLRRAEKQGGSYHMEKTKRAGRRENASTCPRLHPLPEQHTLTEKRNVFP